MRDTALTTSALRNKAMMRLRCFKSHTSTPISISVKSGARIVMATVSMLASCSPMIWAISASDPGSLSARTRIAAGNPLRVLGVHVPAHVEPAFRLVVELRQFRRLDRVDRDRLSRRHDSHDAVPRDRAPVRRETHRQFPMQPADGDGPLVRLALLAQRRFRALVLIVPGRTARPAELQPDRAAQPEPALVATRRLSRLALLCFSRWRLSSRWSG